MLNCYFKNEEIHQIWNDKIIKIEREMKNIT